MEHPKWPIGELTDGELLRYRASLQSAIGQLPSTSGTVDGLRAKLDAVTAEQEARSAARRSGITAQPPPHRP